MAFNREPTVECTRAYVLRSFDPALAAEIWRILERVADSFGDERGYYQAAVLVAWEQDSARGVGKDSQPKLACLESKVAVLNQDPRDFLVRFSPPPFWENRFR